MTPQIYQAIALKTGLELYSKYRMKPNKAWTPKAMLATAERITGKTYKRGQFVRAIEDLSDWIQDQS